MEILSQLMAVGLVLGLLGLGVWALRGRQSLPFRLTRHSNSAARRLESVERLSLSPQHSLHLVRVGQKTILLAVHSAGCTLLDARLSADLSASPAPGDGR